MTIKVLNFGICKEILGGFEAEVTLEDGSNLAQLQNHLFESYPKLKTLVSLRIAINESYGDSDYVIQEKDEVVLIPPVSGG